MKQLSGHTKPFAVLGHPIGHTLSPVMHNAGIERLGMDAIYLAFDVHPDRLLDVLPAMREMGFGGVNLTIPLKETAFNGLELLDESATRLKAVNTVEFTDDGRLRGYNTDGYGIIQAVREAFEMQIQGRRVFVLGTGGAGRAVALTCAAEGAAQIVVSDLDAERTRRVASEIEALQAGGNVRIVGAQTDAQREAARAAELVIQATPVGMKPGDPSPLAADCFRSGQKAIDLIYMYPETAFMRAARSGGAEAVNGLGMLLHQGARSFEIWTGRPAAVDAMRDALEKAVYS